MYISLSTSAGDASNPSSSTFFAITSNVAAVAEHERRAVAAGDVHAPGGADRRRKHFREPVEPLKLIVRLAGLRVEHRQDRRVALQEIQKAVVQHRRRHVRRIAIERPHDRLRSREVAFRVGDADRFQVVAAKPARRDHDAVLAHRRRDRIHRQARAVPDHRAGLEIVAVQLVHARHDHLRAAAMLDDVGRGPRVDLVAAHAPELLAGVLVERRDVRALRVIPHDDQPIAIEHRRASLAELVAHRLVAEIFLPDELAVHVVGVDAARLERRDHVLPVGHRRRRGPRAVVLVRRFVRRFFARRLLPDDAAIATVERHHDVAMHAPRIDAAARRVRLGHAACRPGSR